MKKLFLCMLLLCGAAMPQMQAKEPADAPIEYEIQGAGTGVQGTYLVEVSLLSKAKNVSDAELVSAAIHGVLFRGFANPATNNSQPPLAGSPANEAQHAEFYKTFFSPQGMAKTFGQVARGTRSITKAGKQYKVSANVTVNKDTLLKYLEEMGVVESMDSLF